MEEQLTYKKILPIWWSFFWRSSIVGFFAGGLASFVVGLILGTLTLTSNPLIISTLVGLAVGIPISIWAVRQALIKHKIKLDLRPIEKVFE
ncbi:MAG: hypothetical protein ABJN65_12770 [Parasphingorhabdus sp.]